AAVLLHDVGSRERAKGAPRRGERLEQRARPGAASEVVKQAIHFAAQRLERLPGSERDAAASGLLGLLGCLGCGFSHCHLLLTASLLNAVLLIRGCVPVARKEPPAFESFVGLAMEIGTDTHGRCPPPLPPPL